MIHLALWIASFLFLSFIASQIFRLLIFPLLRFLFYDAECRRLNRAFYIAAILLGFALLSLFSGPAQKTTGGGKTYTQADFDAAVAAYPNITPAQIEAAFKAKGWTKVPVDFSDLGGRVVQPAPGYTIEPPTKPIDFSNLGGKLVDDPAKGICGGVRIKLPPGAVLASCGNAPTAGR